MREAIRWALILSALVHVAAQARRAYRTGRWNGRHAGLIRVANPHGSASLTGCWLAIVLPLAPWWLWPVFGLGLWWSGSVLALAALSGAFVLIRPSAISLLGIGALGAALALWGLSKRGVGGRRAP